ncbi:MAG: SDR family oxidoreductase [Acidobacteria bacterium]|nr:SDR family oxidoreductase [Acidobacteriota bacterium]MBI3489015.1 SDR family oxidoreductase [Acidobacteriota bacterium]
MTTQPLLGKVALVAGGAKNLGGLISRSLADAGAAVLVHYNSPASREAAEATVSAIQQSGGKALALQADLTGVQEIRRLFDTAIHQFGRVDIAINTAGKVLKKPITDTTEAEFDELFALNAKAAYFFVQEAGRRLERDGKIISIATSLLAAFTGHYSAYAASKAPLEHLVRAAAKELASRNISVNNVAPGPLDTPFFHGQESPESVAYLSAASMNGQLGDIRDIAPIVRFLATEGWWINGQTLFANGAFATR